MELPICKSTYQQSFDALRRAIGRAVVVMARTVAEEFATQTATCFTNPNRPDVRIANFAADLSLSSNTCAREGMDEMMAHFASHGTPCHACHAADSEWPASWADELNQRGYQPQPRCVLLLERFTPPQEICSSVQVIPARAAYGELRMFYDRMARQSFGADDRLADDLAATYIDYLDEPRLEMFLARIDRRPVAVAGVLSLGQTGVIRPVYCDPQYRGQGVAAILMNRVLESCQRALFEQVVIDQVDKCSATSFYESLGFRSAGLYIRYIRHVTP